MSYALRGFVTLLGRVLIVAIFLASSVMSDIQHFNDMTQMVRKAGLPSPQLLLGGAIALKILGGLSVLFGFKARFGALLLLIFLVAASYFFHNFWTLQGAQRQDQMIHFMKNVSMMGTMLFLIANGAGPWSIDGRRRLVPVNPTPA